jgi:hypothetical protein
MHPRLPAGRVFGWSRHIEVSRRPPKNSKPLSERSYQHFLFSFLLESLFLGEVEKERKREREILSLHERARRRAASKKAFSNSLMLDIKSLAALTRFRVSFSPSTISLAVLPSRFYSRCYLPLLVLSLPSCSNRPPSTVALPSLFNSPPFGADGSKTHRRGPPSEQQRERAANGCQAYVRGMTRGQPVFLPVPLTFPPCIYRLPSSKDSNRHTSSSAPSTV